MSANPPAPNPLGLNLRALVFCAKRSELLAAGPRVLWFGLLVTWLVGIGRYWDSPSDHWFRYTGLGSVAYAVVLSAILYVIAGGLGPRAWIYPRVLLLVTLTSLPAALYAIPVERFCTPEQAHSLNLRALAVVATWRVALLLYFLRVVARLNIYRVVLASLVLLGGIVCAVAATGRQKCLIGVMAGIRSEDIVDPGLVVVQGLVVIAVVSAIPLWILYLFAAHFTKSVAEDQRAAELAWPPDPAALADADSGEALDRSPSDALNEPPQ